MKRVLLIGLVLATTLFAQAASWSRASSLAQQLGQAGDLPNNVRLRFQVMANQLPSLEKKKSNEAASMWSFFTTTRDMAWSQQLNPATSTTMQQFEQEMVGLAKSKGKNLDLPPVGYAPAGSYTPGIGAGSSGSPVSGGSALLSGGQTTIEGLTTVVQRTEELAGATLASNNSAELLFLRDNLSRLREDLADRTFAADGVRAVMGARVRYLAGDGKRISAPELDEFLAILGEILRNNYPPEFLRSKAGQQLSL